jgi:hypothetical protein
MQYKGYEIKRGKYLYFKGKSDGVFLNTKVLGTAYTEKNLRARIENHTEVKNRKVHIYDDKIVKMSHRNRLKFTIENALQSAVDYKDFLNILRSEDYEIKFGKHLAFRHITGKRFIRSDSIGFEYTEDMLNLFFTNPDEYQRLKNKQIEKLSSPDKSYNKYNAIQDVNIEIRMLNYLNENGIKNYEELVSNIEKLQKQVDINTQNINNINIRISEKKDIIKAVRMYWQYKPIFTQLHTLKSPQERETYIADHKIQLDRYNTATATINRSKKADGSLPKSTELNLEIEKLQTLKDDITTRQNKLKSKLSIYENLKYNLDKILDDSQSQPVKFVNNKPEYVL